MVIIAVCMVIIVNDMPQTKQACHVTPVHCWGFGHCCTPLSQVYSHVHHSVFHIIHFDSRYFMLESRHVYGCMHHFLWYQCFYVRSPGLLGPNLDNISQTGPNLDRPNLDKTKPRHDQTQTGHILDMDISQTWTNPRQDQTQTRQFLDMDISQTQTYPRQTILDTDISQTNYHYVYSLLKLILQYI